MAGFKEFDPEEILSAADVNGFLMNQSTLVFDDDADRDAQVVAPVDGMRAYLKDDGRSQEYHGDDWVDLGKAIQQVVVERATSVEQTGFARALCDQIEFTPLRSDSRLVLEWHGRVRLERISGTNPDFSGDLFFSSGPSDFFASYRHGLFTAASSFNAGFFAPIAFRRVVDSHGETPLMFETRIRPNGTDLKIVSEASVANPNLFSVTEFAPGIVL